MYSRGGACSRPLLWKQREETYSSALGSHPGCEMAQAERR